MIKLFILAAFAASLGGCTFDQTLSSLQTSVPAVRAAAATIICVAAPLAEQTAGAIEGAVAPSLSTLNNLSIAGTQVACSRLQATP